LPGGRGSFAFAHGNDGCLARPIAMFSRELNRRDDTVSGARHREAGRLRRAG
jgi:hypothetical protein